VKVSLVKPTVKSGSRGFIQNLFYKFWTFLQVSTNFGNLKHFLLFKTIRKMVKFSWHSTGLKPARGYSPRGATACHARSAEKPTGPRPDSPAQRGKQPARSPRANRAQGGAVACSPAARRRQGVAGDLEGGTGKVPGKEERAGAHWNGGSTARREESSGTAAFTDGEGAPVVVVECDEVLQLGWGKRVRKLQEIARIGGSGRSSPGNGGQWRRSAGIRAREGIPMAGGGGPGAGSGVESVALERGSERSG
jgi:hypothetical protein